MNFYDGNFRIINKFSENHLHEKRHQKNHLFGSGIDVSQRRRVYVFGILKSRAGRGAFRVRANRFGIVGNFNVGVRVVFSRGDF